MEFRNTNPIQEHKMFFYRSLDHLSGIQQCHIGAMRPWLETGGILMDNESAHMILSHAARNSNYLSFKEIAPQKLYNETLLSLPIM